MLIAIDGIPSIAISITSFQWKSFSFAGELALNIAEKAIEQSWPRKLLLNLNIPPCDEKEMGDLVWTRLSIRQYEEQFIRRVDPRGNTYFWMAGEAVKDIQSAGEGPEERPTDVSQIALCSPSLTPIQPDLFWRGDLDDLPKLI